MIQYVVEIKHPADDDLERLRRVELYRSQLESEGFRWPEENQRHVPFARRVFCEELSEQFPNGFPNLAAAARHLGVNRKTLWESLLHGWLCRGLHVRYMEGPRERTRGGQERPVVCVTTGARFPSLSAAAAWAGVPKSSLLKALRLAHGTPAYWGGRVWRYEGDVPVVERHAREGRELTESLMLETRCPFGV